MDINTISDLYFAGRGKDHAHETVSATGGGIEQPGTRPRQSPRSQDEDEGKAISLCCVRLYIS